MDLEIYEYCAEDDTYTVQGKMPGAVELAVIEEKGKALTDKVMLMERMDVVVLIFDTVTVHIHGNGEIAVNGARSVDQAREILEGLV